MSSINGHSLCILPPFDHPYQWFGYAKNDDHSPSLDGGDDPTPEHTKAFGNTAGECADAVVAKLKAYKAGKS